jgi:hypothetical protein
MGVVNGNAPNWKPRNQQWRRVGRETGSLSDPILLAKLAGGLTCKSRMGFQGHESQRICERVHPFSALSLYRVILPTILVFS